MATALEKKVMRSKFENTHGSGKDGVAGSVEEYANLLRDGTSSSPDLRAKSQMCWSNLTKGDSKRQLQTLPGKPGVGAAIARQRSSCLREVPKRWERFSSSRLTKGEGSHGAVSTRVSVGVLLKRFFFCGTCFCRASADRATYSRDSGRRARASCSCAAVVASPSSLCPLGGAVSSPSFFGGVLLVGAACPYSFVWVVVLSPLSHLSGVLSSFMLLCGAALIPLPFVVMLFLSSTVGGAVLTLPP